MVVKRLSYCKHWRSYGTFKYLLQTIQMQAPKNTPVIEHTKKRFTEIYQHSTNVNITRKLREYMTSIGFMTGRIVFQVIVKWKTKSFVKKLSDFFSVFCFCKISCKEPKLVEPYATGQCFPGHGYSKCHLPSCRQVP